ncbi:MAG: dienelactone hydrolase family protein [Bifidobacteriaceae bacterium]|nr:dienelactone hydrolase family protein [Bifidobacteriaceae bacterium]
MDARETNETINTADTKNAVDTPLFVLLHGFASNERDLPMLMDFIAPCAPWVSLRAPMNLGFNAHAWIPLDEWQNDTLIAVARADLLTWIKDNVPETRKIIPFGFSQGALMASEVLRSIPERCAAGLVLSGFINPVPHIADSSLADSNVPVFVAYGEDDDIVPPAFLTQATEWFASNSNATIKTYANTPHSIAIEELEDIKAWISAIVEGQ